MAEEMQNDLVEEPPRVEPPAERGQTTNRRGALKALAVASGAIYTGALIVPAARMLAPNSSGGTGKARWIRVASLADVKPDEPKRVVVIADEKDGYTITRDQLLGSLWLVRKGDQVKAMSAVCPHLGCSIDLNADKQSYFCPCHVSKFSLLANPFPDLHLAAWIRSTCGSWMGLSKLIFADSGRALPQRRKSGENRRLD